ncbi:MAG: ABC transporter substrate-binding protein [Rhodopseudomonas sp.]|uniref:ABC transporter substrate-binding protein n=1 Tax=Rhodopseudomonas sp. TaxID=1078 RepID=UPI00178E7B44|nr:ABC transporter substrate-binding protein [Rhodopseudomonas sp.]NVN87428.1 ABC transporter substrate-binding protein [Rhodopseudomonas sp.]
MSDFTPDRRTLLKGSALTLAAAATMSAEQLLGYAKAWAADAPWKPEKGAKINLMRWKRFVEAEDVAFMKIVDAFQKATGCTITVSNESYDDIQPKASVAANTGQGLDMVWGLYSLPHLLGNKVTDMADVANYLGGKYGGWTKSAEDYCKVGNKWVGVPIATSGALFNYRIAACEKAGFKEFPKDTAGMLEMFKGLQKNGTPGGMALGHASGDANTWMYWALWTFGGNMVDEKDKVVINSPETAASLEYIKQLYATFIPGTVSWNDSSNNKAFLAGQLYCTINGISIYVAAKKENPAIAEDMNHAYLPIGPYGKPTEMHLAYPMLIFNFTKYPQACKAFTAFMLEAPQFDPWIEAAQGYLSHFLNAYDKNPIWTADPKTTPYRDVAKRARTPAGLGKLGENAAAAIADFILVDMFANYCTGREDLKGSIAGAERQLKRIYRS